MGQYKAEHKTYDILKKSRINKYACETNKNKRQTITNTTHKHKSKQKVEEWTNKLSHTHMNTIRNHKWKTEHKKQTDQGKITKHEDNKQHNK